MLLADGYIVRSGVSVSADSLLWDVAPLAVDAFRAAREVLMGGGGGEIIVSSITAWEIAMLVQRDRLFLSMDVGSWLATVAVIESVRFLPVDVEIALKSVDLPGEFHNDPADRMIVATARKLAAPLVTKDEKIRACAHVKTIW